MGLAGVSLFKTKILLIASFRLIRRDTFSKLRPMKASSNVMLLSAAMFVLLTTHKCTPKVLESGTVNPMSPESFVFSCEGPAG